MTTLLTRQAVLGALFCVARAMPSAAQAPTIPTESQIVHVDVIVTTFPDRCSRTVLHLCRSFRIFRTYRFPSSDLHFAASDMPAAYAAIEGASRFPRVIQSSGSGVA